MRQTCFISGWILSAGAHLLPLHPCQCQLLQAGACSTRAWGINCISFHLFCLCICRSASNGESLSLGFQSTFSLAGDSS
ncbi:hypothetical protein DFH06DRAFT_1252569 [Mycena polygramma]|nr:hypothetical protein DFH06DRAFT_1252569 [Mycena polygramma]